ncbi:ParB N-terminal domain-containing protein [Sphingomonas canadensis]|uniref:ParB N-terminal domain-containing protein n=1 Tax=Sphingomonas canadensis TaxID=1219257 RepID=A0ABW3H2Y2_9SPHN|nr:ParB N-terminal domain-containing protein [Sphingomonas canadensis]MCW3835034.1 ParB N-terminal domain-containing protein [Sphingomonas canadensis]
MKLEFIPLDKLTVSKANMRYAKKAPDVSDILPTVRTRGVIQPLIVRANCDPGVFEIVGGARRFHAARIVAEERRAAEPANPPDAEPLPCAILEGGDDADAVEASLIENLARLDPDEVTQWETFTRLVKEGRSLAELVATFGLPELTIKRVLALGNLLPRIRDLYRKEQIDAATVRHLTLASKGRQKDWLALYDDESAYCPTGHQLKAWLFGGASVPVANALFDVDASGIATVADLFGEDRYFADVAAFWTAQNEAVETRRAAYLDAGWSDAVVVGPDAHFHSWEYEKAPKRKGGRVYIVVSPRGEVTFHEGYLTRKEAQRARRGDGEDGGDTAAPATKPQRPEVTSAMQGYIDLHRHAAVRAALTGHPQIALRLMVAHAITGSHLWSVRPEPQSAPNDVVRESVETCLGETAFDERRRAVLGLLGFDPEEPTVVGGNGDSCGIVGVFLRLLALGDAEVLDVNAIVIGESLAAGSAAVEAVGAEIGVRMADWWQADNAFFEQVRDKEVLAMLVAEVAGKSVADANAKEKGATMKRIIRDCLDGAGGRAKVEGWVPKWMAFPPDAYTTRGGVGTVKARALVVAALTADDEPDPASPGAVALPEPDPEAEPVAQPEPEAVPLAA